jgi:hypothetical protein
MTARRQNFGRIVPKTAPEKLVSKMEYFITSAACFYLIKWTKDD